MSYAHLFTGAAPDEAGPVKASAFRILLVDDEPNVLSALRRVFRQENYDVVTCGDPMAALALLKGEPFNLIISDYMMPVMDGGALLQKARLIDPQMIRIMLTGHADVNAVVGAVKNGAVYKFILKPWNDDDLRVTVALALERQTLARSNIELGRDNERKSLEIAQLAKFNVSNRSRLATMLHKHGLLTLGQVQELLRIGQQA